MTFKEKYCKDHCVDLESMIGYGCPYGCGYEAGPACADVVMHCDDCWNREMPDAAQVKESADISHTPAVNCANCEKHEEEIARLNARILEDKEYIDKLREKLEDRNEELDLYRLMFWTIEATLKIELPDVHTWRKTHD